MRNLLHRSTLKIACLLGALLASAQIASAQAYVSAQRGADLSPFVQYTMISPDWGTQNNFGYTAGIDYTHFIRAIVQPSIEFRYTRANGQNVNERSYSGGLKLATLPIHGVQPYITLLAGHGNIDFVHPTGNYYSDASAIYSIGGGGEFNVTSQLRVRLDVTQQHWNFDPNTLTPMTFGLGVSYSIRPRGRRTQ